MLTVTRVDWNDRQLGDVGCLHGTGLISNLIIASETAAHEVLDGTTWSHCFIAGCALADDQQSLDLSDPRILEAVFPKISLSPYDEYDGQTTALFRIGVDPALIQQVLLQVILEYVGRGYDVGGVAFGMAAMELARALCLPADNNVFANQHQAWCSELATDFIQKLIADPDKPSTEDPQQVYNYLNALTA